MRHDSEAEARCAAMLAALSSELNWRLDASQQRAYVAALAAHLGDTRDPGELRRVITAYHYDHRLVQALREARDPQHDAAWLDWSEQVVRITHHQARRAHPTLVADVHDLAQLALEEIAQSLHSYHFASRFSTWAYAVSIRRIKRYLRDARAAKRATQPESLDQHPRARLLAADDAAVESPAEAAALRDLVLEVLARHGDQRLALIFYLWVFEEQRLTQIGSRLRLSPSRISVLLDNARQILRSDPALLAWLDTLDEPDEVAAERPSGEPHTQQRALRTI